MAQQPTAPAPVPGKMVKMALTDRTTIYNSYMSFLNNGGVFIASDDAFEMGDEVLLVLEIGDALERFPLKTKVCWINPKRGSSTRPRGVGLAFDNSDVAKNARHLIENNLAGLLDLPRATYTI